MALNLASNLTNSALNAFWRWGANRAALSDAEKEAALRGLLRRFPFWATGHLNLAALALRTDNVALAYSSAIAGEILSATNFRQESEAVSLLGRCFLQRGDWQNALKHFNRARSLGMTSHKLAEDTAAAYMLGGAYDDALSALSGISPANLSTEGRAALEFVRDKCS